MTENTYTLKLPGKMPFYDVALLFSEMKEDSLADKVLHYLSFYTRPKGKIVVSEHQLSHEVSIDISGIIRIGNVPVGMPGSYGSSSVGMYRVATVRINSEPIVDGKEYSELTFIIETPIDCDKLSPSGRVVEKYIHRLQKKVNRGLKNG